MNTHTIHTIYLLILLFIGSPVEANYLTRIARHIPYTSKTMVVPCAAFVQLREHIKNGKQPSQKIINEAVQETTQHLGLSPEEARTFVLKARNDWGTYFDNHS